MNTKKCSTPASAETVNMALFNAGNDVQDLQYRIHCATELVRMVHTAIVYGPNEAGEDEHDALFGAYWLLQTIDAELEKAGDRLWSAIWEVK